LPAALERGISHPIRDYSREKPVGDELFAAYARVYSYDRTPIAGRIESTDDSGQNWRRETISIPAAYGNERVLVQVLLPKRGKPPYQAILHLSGSSMYDLRSSIETASQEGGFLVQEGRAVILPVVRGAYERSAPEFRSDTPRTSAAFRDHVIDMYKDVARTVDYLETRGDIAMDKLGYVGWSRGAALAPIVLALERRIRTAVLCIPGFYTEQFAPEIDVINFAPRVTVPVLVLNGKYDFAFPAQLQEPFFNALGTPPADKRRIVYPTGHNLPPIETIKETLTWLDKYLGPVD
jgi:dienelactone hydrolase